MQRVTILAVAGILLLGAGAVWTIHLAGSLAPGRRVQAGESGVAGTQPGPAGMETQPGVEPATGWQASSPASPGPAASGPAARAPSTLPVNSQVQFKVKASPPPMPANGDDRAARVQELRKQRRETGIDQLNAREAARRARLGLAPPQPLKGVRQPPDVVA